MLNEITFTESEAQSVYAALLNSVDVVAQEHDDHVRMWGNPAIPTRQGQRSSLRVKKLEHEAAMGLLKAKLANGGHHG